MVGRLAFCLALLCVLGDFGGTTDVSAAQSGDMVMVTVSVPARTVGWLPSLMFVKGTVTGNFSMPHE